MSTLGERDELVRRAKGWTEADLRKFPTATLELIDSLAAALVAEGPGAAPLVGAANPIYWEGYNAALDEWELRAAAAPSLHKEPPQEGGIFLTATEAARVLPREYIHRPDKAKHFACWCRECLESYGKQLRAAAALHKEGAGGAPGWTGIEHFDCGCSVKREAITPCQRHLAFWKKHWQ